MRPPDLARRRRVALLPACLLPLSLLLAGCSRGTPVDVPNPPPEGPGAYVCADFKAALPDEVAGQTTVATSPQSVFTAGWGDPTITVRCGVAVPTALQPTSQVVTVDGVDWLPEQLTNGWLFTTVGRVLPVEVSVPSAYDPAAEALVDLAPAVKQAVPVASASPSGSPATTPAPSSS